MRRATRSPNSWRRIAAAGAGAWVLGVAAAAVGGRLDATVSALAFAPLVVVPLGLSCLGAGAVRGRLEAVAVMLHLPVAVAAALAAAWEPGLTAGVLAAPWAVVSLLWAAAGVFRFARSPKTAEGTCVDAALVFLSVGGAFLLLAALGARPLGFGPEIVRLTAVHFHYAGFVLPLLAGLTGRALGPGAGTRPAYRFAVAAAVGGPPVLAIGINVSQLLDHRLLELVAAAVLSAGVVVLAVLFFAVACRRSGPLARLFILIAASSAVFSMPAALVYAAGRFLRDEIVSIPTMAATHGLANAFGFCLCGLLYFSLEGTREPGTASPVPPGASRASSSARS